MAVIARDSMIANYISQIERFASAYILRTNGALDDSTRAIRDKLLAAKQMAVKY